MSDQIKVAIKVRPLIERENLLKISWIVCGNTIFQADPSNGKPRGELYTFDHIFDKQCTNSEIFGSVVKPLVDAAVKGFNATIFAYGQTSSGKTYTMLGEKDECGITQLAVTYMFEAMKRSRGREFLARASYLEIYNEKVSDLLEEGKGNLKIREMDGNIVVVNLKEELVATSDKVMSLMNRGEKIRHFGETNMNERSSRSHTIFRIIIESRLSDCGDEGAVQVSQLNLVDLAGSERLDQKGATGDRLKEGCAINSSLFMLGHVISQLSEGHKQHINFRNSKLTRILQPSLGGNALTLIICTITPAAIEETHCTLGFASRAKTIRIEPHVNQVLSDGTLLQRYARQLVKLRAELQEAKTNNRAREMVAMESRLVEKDRHNKLLQARIDLLKEKLIVSGASSKAKKMYNRRRTRCASTGRRSYIPMCSETCLETIEEETTQAQHNFSYLESNTDELQNESQFQTPLEEFELQLMSAEEEKSLDLDSSIPQLFHSELFEDAPFVLPEDCKDSTATVYPGSLSEKSSIDVACQTDPIDASCSSSEPNTTPPHELRERVAFWENECELQRIEYEQEKEFMFWENEITNDLQIEESQQKQACVLQDRLMEENSRLNKVVNEKDNTIVHLQEQLCALERNSTEASEVREKLQALQEENSRFTDILAERNDVINNLNAMQEENCKLHEIIVEKDLEIVHMQKELSSLSSKVYEHHKQNKLRETNSSYLAIVAEKDRTIQDFQGELFALQTMVAEVQKLYELKEEDSKYLEIPRKDKRSQTMQTIEVVSKLDEEQTSKYTEIVAEKKSKIQELEDKLCAQESKQQYYLELVTEKDAKIQGLEEHLVSLEAIIVMAQQLGKQEETSWNQEIVMEKENKIDCTQDQLLSSSMEKNAGDICKNCDKPLEEKCTDVKETMKVDFHPMNNKRVENLWYLECILKIDHAISTMQKRVKSLILRTGELGTILGENTQLAESKSEKDRLIKGNTYQDVIHPKLELAYMYSPLKNLDRQCGNDADSMTEVSTCATEDTNRSILCRVVSNSEQLVHAKNENCLKTENYYLKSLSAQALKESQTQSKEESEKLYKGVNFSQCELHTKQSTVKNCPVSSFDHTNYSGCLDLLKQQNLSLRESMDELRSYKKGLLNEIVSLDPSYDQQALQKCELLELLDTFNKCIMRKEEEVFGSLQQQCEELSNDNSTMKKLIESLELDLHEKDQEIKSLLSTITNQKTDKEMLLVKVKDKVCIEQELKNEQSHLKVLKEEVNLTSKLQELETLQTFSTEIQRLFASVPELDADSDIVMATNLIIEKVNIVQTLNEDTFILKNQLAEVNQKNYTLKKHIECLELDIQEKEEENKDLANVVKGLQNDKETLLMRVREKMQSLEALEQELQVLRNEQCMMKVLKEEVDTFTAKSQRLEKLEAMNVEIHQLFGSLPELDTIRDCNIVSAIKVISQKVSTAQKLAQEKFLLYEQLAELDQKCNTMKECIKNLQLDIQAKNNENKELIKTLKDLQIDKESWLVNVNKKVQSLEIVGKELGMLKTDQLDVKILKEEVITKSQQLEKLEIINVEIQQLIASALECNIIPDCDLVTAVHLLIQKVGQAQTLVEDAEQLADLNHQCNTMKKHAECLQLDSQEKDHKNQELMKDINDLKIEKENQLLEIAEKDHSLNMMEEEARVLNSEQSHFKALNKKLTIKLEKLEAQNAKILQLLASVLNLETDCDISTAIHLLTQKVETLSEDKMQLQDQLAELINKNNALEKQIECFTQHKWKSKDDFAHRMLLETNLKELSHAIQVLQTEKNYLEQQIEQMKKEVENTLADRAELELEVEWMMREIVRLTYSLQNLDELERVQREMKRLFASLPELGVDTNSDATSAINIIIQKVNSHCALQAKLTDIEMDKQTLANRMKRQIRDLNRNKKMCWDLEEKADYLEENNKVLEIKLKEKNNAIESLQADKTKLEMELSDTSRKLIQHGPKCAANFIICSGNCAPSHREVTALQHNIKELEEQVADLTMELQQKNMENEGAFNLASDLTRSSSEYEMKYQHLQAEMLELQNQMCYMMDRKMSTHEQQPCTILVSTAVNTDESAECRRCKILSKELQKMNFNNVHHKTKIDTLKLKIHSEEITYKREAEDLEKCLEVARSKISELKEKLQCRQSEQEMSKQRPPGSVCDKVMQTDRESTVLQRMCGEGSGIVSEHELLQSEEKIKKLEKDKRLLKALSRERLLRLYIAKGKMKPPDSDRSSVPRLSPERLPVLGRYAREMAAKSCKENENSSKKCRHTDMPITIT